MEKEVRRRRRKEEEKGELVGVGGVVRVDHVLAIEMLRVAVNPTITKKRRR